MPPAQPFGVTGLLLLLLDVQPQSMVGRGELCGGSPPRGPCEVGPERRERLPRLSEEEITDATPRLRAAGEMLEPDRISGSLFLARATERQSGRALSQRCRKVLRFPTIRPLPRFWVSLPAGSPERFAGTVWCVPQMAPRLSWLVRQVLPNQRTLTCEKRRLRPRSSRRLRNLSMTSSSSSLRAVLWAGLPSAPEDRERLPSGSIAFSSLVETLGPDCWISFWYVCLWSRLPCWSRSSVGKVLVFPVWILLRPQIFQRWSPSGPSARAV